LTTDLLNYYPLLIPLAPIVAAALAALPGRDSSVSRYRMGWWALVAGFVVSLPVIWRVAAHSAEPIRVVLLEWPWTILPVWELYIDRLSATMMVVISGLGTLIYRYSIRYLQEDAGQRLYQTMLALAISSLLFMVSAADLVTLFISWQLLSWLLSLLLHNYSHAPAAQASFRTFFMLRIGDVAFLAGIVLAYHLYGTLQFTPLFERAAADPIQLTLLGGLTMSGATAVTLLIFIGAMAKSAQFPIHVWVTDSLFGPTPVSALLHAGLINAGGFLLNRLAPLYALSTPTLNVVFAVGLVTAVLGTGMMLMQNDIKKTLGYSTIGQMGYMIMECGLGAFSLAVFHLIAHGLFKASLFLNSGDEIHQNRHDPQRPQPITAAQHDRKSSGWLTALIVSLVLPLVLVYAAHHFLEIAILDSHGLLIFLLFSWVTASQATLTMFHSNIEASVAEHGYMLVVVGLVSTAYLFAAETFTHFLYPEAGVVATYFQAGALPQGVFWAVAALFVLTITGGWFFVYADREGQRKLRSRPLFTHLYLFFVNDFYLDAFGLRFYKALRRAGRALDRSQVPFLVLAVIALVIAGQGVAQGLSGDSLGAVAGVLAAGLLLPLFPFHIVYVTALTRAPRGLTVALSILLPTLGIGGAAMLIPKLPPSALSAVSVLAAIGAFWGSIKALVQVRVSGLLAHAGLALYSVLWWYLAQGGKLTLPSMVYALGVTLALGGLAFGWDRIRVRYGDLDLNHIGGLSRPMPRFALCMAILVMAVVGLPPFAVYFGYIAMLISPSTTMSAGLVAVLAAWLAASWYMFGLMRRLLFGPHRTDLRYEDLGPAEIGAFVVVIALLVLLGSVPQEWMEAGVTMLAHIQGGVS
jgi:NADH-quinone oxidoreductase subunit L